MAHPPDEYSPCIEEKFVYEVLRAKVAEVTARYEDNELSDLEAEVLVDLVLRALLHVQRLVGHARFPDTTPNPCEPPDGHTEGDEGNGR